MSESVIADFVAKFNAEGMDSAEPTPGRVLLSQKRLVLAAREDSKLTIPLADVFDVAVGHVPSNLGDFFDSTVTVAYERNGGRHVAAVEADDEKIEKFERLLFKSLLNGTETTVKERARVGGRVTDDEFEPAALYLDDGLVEFRREADAFAVELASVTDFERTSREIGGLERPVLVVRHRDGTRAITSIVAMSSPRKMSILGRYLRLEYQDLLSELEDVELTTDKKELLVTLYSTRGLDEATLAEVVSADGSQMTMLLRELAEDGLLADGEAGPELTRTGEIVASNNLEDVNA